MHLLPDYTKLKKFCRRRPLEGFGELKIFPEPETEVVLVTSKLTKAVLKTKVAALIRIKFGEDVDFKVEEVPETANTWQIISNYEGSRIVFFLVNLQ